MTDNFVRNLAAGIIGDEDRKRLQRGASAWLRARGALTLERCLGIPRTTAAMARAERDVHIYNAWELIDGPTPWQKSVALAAEVKTFLTRIWPQWQNEAMPPDRCSELRRSLFLAKRAAERAGITRFPETAERLHGIVLQSTK